MSLTSLRRRHKTFHILHNLIREKIEKIIPVVLDQRCGERIEKKLHKIFYWLILVIFNKHFI